MKGNMIKNSAKNRIKICFWTLCPVICFSVFSVGKVWAQEAAAPVSSSSQPTLLESLFPFLVIFVIFYFLVIRPQAKKAKNHASFVANLKKGDHVITASGFLGTIEGVTQNFVDVSIAEDVRVKVLRSQIASYTKEVS